MSVKPVIDLLGDELTDCNRLDALTALRCYEQRALFVPGEKKITSLPGAFGFDVSSNRYPERFLGELPLLQQVR